jgi:hypothetical protein
LVFPQTKTWYNGSTTVLPSSAPVAGSPSAYKRHISWEKRWDPGRSLRSLRSLSRGGLVIPLLSWSTCWATYCDSWGCWYLKSWIYIYRTKKMKKGWDYYAFAICLRPSPSQRLVILDPTFDFCQTW